MPKDPPDLSIATEKVCFIVVKDSEFDVKDVVTDPDDASNASDDSMISVLEDHGDDPVADELRGFIGALNEDEQTDLVALAWLGLGVAMARLRIGANCVRKPRAHTTSAQPPICSECRSLPIISRGSFAVWPVLRGFRDRASVARLIASGLHRS